MTNGCGQAFRLFGETPDWLPERRPPPASSAVFLRERIEDGGALLTGGRD